MSKYNHFDAGKGSTNRSPGSSYWNGYSAINWNKKTQKEERNEARATSHPPTPQREKGCHARQEEAAEAKREVKP